MGMCFYCQLLRRNAEGGWMPNMRISYGVKENLLLYWLNVQKRRTLALLTRGQRGAGCRVWG